MLEDDEEIEQTVDATDSGTDSETDSGTSDVADSSASEQQENTNSAESANSVSGNGADGVRINESTENVNISEEQDMNVGGEQQEEPAVTEIKEGEELPKKTGELGNDQQEDDSNKREREKFHPIKDQDISQYLWEEFLKFISWALDKFDEKVMAGLDHVIDNLKTSNIERSNDCKKDIPHAQRRGLELLNGDGNYASHFVDGLDNRMLSNYSFVAENPEGLRNILERAARVSYTATASRHLHDVMAKDDSLEFAYMDNADLKKKMKKPLLNNFHNIMIGVASTALAAEDYLRASGITDEREIAAKKAIAVNKYLEVMESQAAKTKTLTEQNLTASNFVANEKEPTKELRTEINKLLGALDKSQLFGKHYVAAIEKTAKQNDLSIKKDLKSELKERLKVPNNGNKTLAQLSMMKADLGERHDVAAKRRDIIKKFRDDLAGGGKAPANKFTMDKSLENTPQRKIISDLLGGRRI